MCQIVKSDICKSDISDTTYLTRKKSIVNCKVKMQVYTGADSAVISLRVWTELDKPQFDGKIRRLEVMVVVN